MNNCKYLQIIERPLDSAQQEVCFTNQNSVIAAGAGSGKTQVLATRFAYLVISEKIKVSEILTLTFTDKAASEMYQRIYSTLKYFADYKTKSDEELLDFFAKKRGIQKPTEKQIKEFREGEKDLTEDKKLLAKKALLDFSNAHIQTLDSYCGSIVRLCSNRYGFRPDFSVGSADSKRRIKNLALSYVLNNGDKEGIKNFCEPGAIEKFSNDVLAKKIIAHTSIASPQNYFIEKFQNQKKEIKKIWNKILCGKGPVLPDYGEPSLKEKMDELKDKFKEFNSIFDQSKPYYKMIENLLLKYKQADIDYDRYAFCENDSIESKKEYALKLKEFLDAVANCNGKTAGYKKDFTPYFSAIQNSVPIYLSIVSFILDVEILEDTTKHFDNFLSIVNKEKRQTGMLSFSDVTELALKILIENEDIRNQEKNAYKKIMIDEFQDNNAKNRDFLYLLSLKKGEYESENGNCIIPVDSTDPESLHNLLIKRDKTGQITDDKRDPDKLFFVGDEKQSIYKFKGADVSVFNELTKENSIVNMSFNYRSKPELLSAFNIFFKNNNGIFPYYSEESKNDYEAYYINDALKNGPDGIEELPELTHENVPIHIRLLDTSAISSETEESPFLPKVEQEAYFTAKTIYETAKKEFGNLPLNEWRWDDFAILDSTRTHRGKFTKYLRLFNIPFEVDMNKNIFEDGVINDFYNFLRLCVYPSDEKACAGYLCSPLCGISESSLETVLSYLINVKERYSPDCKPFSLLNKDFDKEIKSMISESEFNKFSAGRQFYEIMKEPVLRQEITKTLTYLWHYQGYKYETYINNSTKLSSEHFDLLFEIARAADSDGKTVSWFIDELDNLQSFYSSSDSDLEAGDTSYPIERNHAVKIMTIHKSKGLQFKHVFIWGCVGASASGDGSTFQFTEKDGLTMKCPASGYNYFSIRNNALEKKLELAEFRRLIYVAVTRAINDVYILGSWNKKIGSSEIGNIFSNIILMNYDAAELDGTNPVYKPGTSFDFMHIPPQTYSVTTGMNSNQIDPKVTLLQNIEKNLSSENENPVLQTLKVYEKVAPSHLEENENLITAKSAYSETDLYKDLSKMLFKYNPEKNNEKESDEDSLFEENEEYLNDKIFKSTDYGTMVHDFLCKMILGVDINNYVPEEKMFKNLTEKDRDFVLNQCRKMCLEFSKSAIYEQIKKSIEGKLFYKAEYEFKMFYDLKMIRGSIDLIFENPDGTYTLLDYKTDREIIPEKHYKQQNCYRIAAEDLIPHKGKINCFLYYLRFNKLIEITDNI